MKKPIEIFCVGLCIAVEQMLLLHSTFDQKNQFKG